MRLPYLNPAGTIFISFTLTTSLADHSLSDFLHSSNTKQVAQLLGL
jgi:hypothetical protein